MKACASTWQNWPGEATLVFSCPLSDWNQRLSPCGADCPDVWLEVAEVGVLPYNQECIILLPNRFWKKSCFLQFGGYFSKPILDTAKKQKKQKNSLGDSERIGGMDVPARFRPNFLHV